MADDFENRDRGNGVRQRFVRVQPVEFVGSTKLEHRHGGTKPLHVAESIPGVYVSTWMIDGQHARKFMREMRNSGRKVMLSLVVDTKVPGHPSVSMQLQEIFLTKD